LPQLNPGNFSMISFLFYACPLRGDVGVTGLMPSANGHPIPMQDKCHACQEWYGNPAVFVC